MKKRWLSVIVALAVVFSFFAGCKNNDDDDDSVAYTLSVDNSTLSFDAGSTGTINVTTNGTFTAKSDTESIATVATSGNVVTVTGVAAGSAIVTVTCKEDTAKTADVTVTVNPTTMTLTLDYSAITNKANVASATVTYGNYGNGMTDTSDDKFTTVTGTVDASAYKVTAEIAKSYESSSGWYNATVITLKDSSGTEISPITWSNNGSAVDYFEFNGSGLTLTGADKTEETGTLTLTFTGFTIVGGSASIHYGTLNGTYVDATATVATDGASATATLSNKYTNASSYFTNVTVTVKDSSGTAVSPTYTDNFAFNSSGMALTLATTTSAITYNVTGVSKGSFYAGSGSTEWTNQTVNKWQALTGGTDTYTDTVTADTIWVCMQDASGTTVVHGSITGYTLGDAVTVTVTSTGVTASSGTFTSF